MEILSKYGKNVTAGDVLVCITEAFFLWCDRWGKCRPQKADQRASWESQATSGRPEHHSRAGVSHLAENW